TAYAALPIADRDVIVRWAETRRRIKVRDGIDHDPANLADPLLSAERLRAHVRAGESAASGHLAFADTGGDLLALVDLRRRPYPPNSDATTSPNPLNTPCSARHGYRLPLDARRYPSPSPVARITGKSTTTPCASVKPTAVSTTAAGFPRGSSNEKPRPRQSDSSKIGPNLAIAKRFATQAPSRV